MTTSVRYDDGMPTTRIPVSMIRSSMNASNRSCLSILVRITPIEWREKSEMA